jgi:type IV secretory pathway VirB2 component (pilin)
VKAPELALNGAIEWIRTAMMGYLATSIAIFAIAGIGFLMLSGRIAARRAATVIIGCFILFSAATIANGLIGAMAQQPVATAEIAPAAYTPSTPRPSSNDPYAGASVPDQRTKDIFK